MHTSFLSTAVARLLASPLSTALSRRTSTVNEDLNESQIRAHECDFVSRDVITTMGVHGIINMNVLA